MDDFRTRLRWRDAGFWYHFGHSERDEAGRQENTDEKGQETKKIVCQDDEFVYRGANPRTGIVSPFIFGEGSGNIWQDLEKPAQKTGQIEDCLGCRQVANVPLIPIIRRFDGEPSCMKSKVLQHTKVFSHINSEPTSMRDEKIQEYQGNLVDARRSKAQNSVGMGTPVISLTPPPTELQYIRRKKVGSGQVPKGTSTDSKSYEILKDSVKKIATNDISAFGTSTISSMEPRKAPLTAQAEHLYGNLENSVTTRSSSIIASAASNVNSAVSNRYIARSHFLQPTLNASQSISYHSSGQLLAKPPKSIDSRDNRRNIGNASTADTSCKPGKPEQRPQVYRKFGTTSIPTVDSHESEFEEGCKYLLSLAPQGNESITKQGTRSGKINPNFQHFNRQECTMSSLGREKAEVPATRSRPYRQCIGLQYEYPPRPIDVSDHKSSISMITSEKYSQSPKDRPVCPNGNIYVGNHTERDVLRMRAGSRPEKLGKKLSRPMPETGFAFSLEIPDKEWLIGLHPDTAGDKADYSYPKVVERKDVELSYPNHIAQRLVEFLGLFTREGSSLATLVKIEYISKWLLHMIDHAISTLHHSSPAMQVIGNSDPMIGEYISAMISVLLAVFYLLLLLNILIALGKVVKVMGKTLWLIWVPTRVIVLLLKWCIFN